MAIGIEGGFDPDSKKKKYEYTDNYSIVVLPNFDSIPISDPSLPEIVSLSVKTIIESDSAFKLAELEAMSGTWDGEARVISRYADI